jgi:hypothetical protein
VSAPKADTVDVAAVARFARELHAQAQARAEAFAREASRELAGISAALGLLVQVWTTSDLVAVAGALLRLAPGERPELLVEAARAWHVGSGGLVEDDDLGDERGQA